MMPMKYHYLHNYCSLLNHNPCTKLTPLFHHWPKVHINYTVLSQLSEKKRTTIVDLDLLHAYVEPYFYNRRRLHYSLC